MAAPPTEESLAAVLISLLVALFGGLLAHTTVCAEQHECAKHETCYSVSGASCSFRTTFMANISPVAFCVAMSTLPNSPSPTTPWTSKSASDGSTITTHTHTDGRARQRR